jgi:hypothetical protein
VPQRRDRVEAQCAARRQPGGEGGGCHQGGGHGEEGERIVPADAVQQAGQQPGRRQGGGDAEGGAEQRQPQAVADDQPQDVRRPGAR